MSNLLKIRGFGEGGQADGPPVPVHRVFESFARSQPRALAATFQDQELTYAELEMRSNQLAHHLITRGVGLGASVGVCVDPSLDVLVAILAIFKAGGIYLPLDPSHPPALLEAVLVEAQPRLLLTHARFGALTGPERAEQLFLDEPLPGLARQSEGPPVTLELHDPLDRPCTLLYTSGTTGKPKGVVVSHRNLAHYISVARQRFRFAPSDVFCSLARYTFSISLFELLSPLCCGGSVRLLTRDEVLTPVQLSRALQNVTVVHAGPSLLSSLFRHLRANPAMARGYPRVRHASSGGDVVPPALMEEMKTVFDGAELFVIYGCTEISCMGCSYAIPRDRKIDATYVGSPFAEVSVRVLAPSRDVVPPGIVGEIFFAGPGLVDGYLDQPGLTSEKFVQVEGRRFYATGDLGRWSDQGDLEILGRRDHQVQVRGARVELVGIENTVRTLGLADDCVTALRKPDDQEGRLVAFVVNPRETDVAAFRRALGAHLPDYMLPQSLIEVDALPLTANGKVDRQKLQEWPLEGRPPRPGGNAPRDAVERTIAGSFSRVLDLPEVGIDDDFFELGGHSLLAVALLYDLQEALGFTFSLHVIFEESTVRRLATHSRSSFSSLPTPILLNKEGTGREVYALMGIHLYRELARCLDGAVSLYGVYTAHELVMFESTDAAPSLMALAREYVGIIQRHQPHGPYRLLGMSFAGIVAFEVARQLIAAGEEVTFLGLLDAILPERGVAARVRQLRHALVHRPRSVLPLLVKLTRARVRARFFGGPPDTGELPHSKIGPLENQRLDAYRAATEAYLRHLRPFAGPATLIGAERRRTRHLLQTPSLGWEDIIPALEIHALDSEHLGLLQQPSVRQVAGIVLADLGA